MNKSKTFNIKHRIYFVFSITAAVIFTFLQTYLLYNFYETDTFLFNADTNLPSIIYAALLVCVFLTATSIFFFRKEIFPQKHGDTNALMTFISMLTGLVFLVLIAVYVYNFVIGEYDFNVKLHMGLKYISVIFAFPAAIYFLIIALKKDPYKNSTAIFGLCVVVWSTLNLMGEYFNMNSPLNDPVRIIHQISYITIMLFYLYEAGYSAEIRKPVLYHMFGYIAVIFTTISSVPPILLNITGSKQIDTDTISCYVELCLMLFIVCRMISMKNKSEEITGGITDTNEK